MKLITTLLFSVFLTACSGLFTPEEQTVPVTSAVSEDCTCEECKCDCEQDKNVSDVLNEQTQTTAAEPNPATNEPAADATSVANQTPATGTGTTSGNQPAAETPSPSQPAEGTGTSSANQPTTGNATPSANQPAANNQTPSLTEPPLNNAILGNLRFTEYIVEPGDTLSAIANEFGVTVANIQEWNQLEDFNIFAGQILSIGRDISVFLEEQSGVVSETVSYLLEGQAEKAEADRLNWNEAFLNKLDLTALHQQYVDGGGNPDDVENFAIFLTQNAPVMENWEQEFKLQVFSEHQVQISRLEPLTGDNYQAYTMENGSEVPYGIVSSRTGYLVR